MADTIQLPEPIDCPSCETTIKSVQTHAFDCAMRVYRVGDCVAHAEDVRIAKEAVFCSKCGKDTPVSLYVVVQRGILIGVERDFASAQRCLSDLNLEKLVLWYHDLYRAFAAERSRAATSLGFLRDLLDWYRARPEEREHVFRGGLMRGLLQEARDPLEAIEKYLGSWEGEEEEEGGLF